MLTKAMFGSEFSPRSPKFGIQSGQMRSGYGDDLKGKWTHNSGWYNRLGEKLGWGDLSAADFKRIQEEIEEGDFFVVLCESDSFWAFVKNPRPTFGWDQDTERTADNPGVDYIVEKAMWVVEKGHIYSVGPKKEPPYTKSGLVVEPKTTKEIKQILVDSNDCLRA